MFHAAERKGDFVLSAAKTNKKDLPLFLISVTILLFCEAFFFRNVLFNDRLIADNLDGRLTMLITEHWHRVVCGKASVADIGMMYPSPNTLGYSDLLLVYGVIHTLLRFAGLDVFLAYKYTIIAVHIFGTFTAYYLLKRVLNCRHFWTLFGVIAFSFSDTYAAHIGHTQLAAISFLPFVTILWVRFFQNFNNRKKRNIYAFSGILSLVLLVYTSWYIACFTALFIMIFGVIYAIELVVYDRKLSSELKGFFGTVRFDILLYIVFGAVLMIPFAVLELPVMKMSGGRPFTQVVPHMPEIIDIIHVPDTNWLMRSFLVPLELWKRDVTGEVVEGFSIVLLFVFVLVKLLMVRYGKKEHDEKENRTLIIYEALWAAVVVSIVSTVRLSSTGLSVWRLFYELIPGISSLRAIARFFLYLSFPMAMVTAVTANKLTTAHSAPDERKEKNSYSLLWGLAFIMLFVSNIDVKGVSSAWTHSSGSNFINSVAPPPEDCKIFYIVDDSEKGKIEVHLDAYEIADQYGIQTINGYTGLIPTGYDGVWECLSQNYRSAVAEWIRIHDLHDVYVYDLTTNTWTKHDDE